MVSPSQRASRSRTKASLNQKKRQSTTPDFPRVTVGHDTECATIVDAHGTGSTAKRSKLPTLAPKKSSEVGSHPYDDQQKGDNQEDSDRSYHREDTFSMINVDSCTVTLAQQPRFESPLTVDQEINIYVAQSDAPKRASPRFHHRSVSLPPAAKTVDVIGKPVNDHQELAPLSSPRSPRPDRPAPGHRYFTQSSPPYSTLPLEEGRVSPAGRGVLEQRTTAQFEGAALGCQPT